VCYRCEPIPSKECSLCGSLEQAIAVWPLGPVCRGCYKKTLNAKERCASCAAVLPLIAYDKLGARICANCANVKQLSACKSCGVIEELYEKLTCAKCALKRRLRVMLGHDGELSKNALQICHALEQTSQPWAALAWLGRAKSVEILCRVAQHDGDLTHDVLDALPSGQPVNFVRELLVSFGLLPAYDRYANRLERWMDKFFASAEDALVPQAREDLRLLRTFATWSVLQRTRKRSDSRPTSVYSLKQARRQIRASLDLIKYAANLGRGLDSLTQGDVDEWISVGPSTRGEVRHFLNWAWRGNSLRRLVVVCRKERLPQSVPWPSEKRWATVRKLLHDHTIDLALRVAGLLLVVYGQSLSRIARIPKVDIVSNEKGVHLKQRRGLLRLGPGVAEMASELSAAQQKRGTFDQYMDSPWLFPGLLPSGHLSPSQLSERLNDIGVDVYGARTRGLIDLAATLPTRVLADMMGIDITTATNWSMLARPDASHYVGLRAHEPAERRSYDL
jgi:hypothetical protein